MAKASNNLFKLIYYSTWTCVGYYIIRDMESLPPMMGGKGSFQDIFNEFPVWTKPRGFDIFYCASIGYHLESAFSFILSPAKDDFVEMILHHITTICLILFSYSINVTQHGVLVLLIHHFSDIFTSATRAFLDIKSKARDILFLGIIVTWKYSRLYVFFYLIKDTYFLEVEIPEMEVYADTSRGPKNMFLLFLAILYVLHVFWMYKFY